MYLPKSLQPEKISTCKPIEQECTFKFSKLSLYVKWKVILWRLCSISFELLSYKINFLCFRYYCMIRSNFLIYSHHQIVKSYYIKELQWYQMDEWPTWYVKIIIWLLNSSIISQKCLHVGSGILKELVVSSGVPMLILFDWYMLYGSCLNLTVFFVRMWIMWNIFCCI